MDLEVSLVVPISSALSSNCLQPVTAWSFYWILPIHLLPRKEAERGWILTLVDYIFRHFLILHWNEVWHYSPPQIILLLSRQKNEDEHVQSLGWLVSLQQIGFSSFKKTNENKTCEKSGITGISSKWANSEKTGLLSNFCGKSLLALKNSRKQNFSWYATITSWQASNMETRILLGV